MNRSLAPLAGGLITVAVMASAAARRSPLVRANELGRPRAPVPPMITWRHAVSAAPKGLERLGAVVRRLASRSENHHLDVRLGASLLLGPPAVVVHPAAALVVLVGVWASPMLAARVAERRDARAVVEHLPDVIELLRLAVAGGLTVGHAVVAVAPRVPEPFGSCFAEVERRVSLGMPLVGALDTLRSLGDHVVPLHLALVSCERDGAALGRPLHSVTHEARLVRQRRAEERARRLPVQLLFPLVLCILPSFGLLTVVPLLAGSLRSLTT
jgi:tight adherence protein C